MPVAPVAKGIIFSLSILIAAGIAVYDNPQVREWIDQSRRKIALAFNGPGADTRPSNSSRIATPGDVSIREDSSPEAAERRRQAKEEILLRRQLMEERRRAKSDERRRKSGTSFDQLVNSDGSLREKENEIDLEAMAAAITTAAERIPDEGLKRRTKEAVGVAMGSTVANPFADEMGMDGFDEKLLLEQGERSQQDRERSVTVRGDSPLAIDTAPRASNTEADDGMSSHDSELLVDLTPTTSVAPSVSATLLSSPIALTPTSTNHPSSQAQGEGATQPPQQPSFQSIQEWASTASTGGPASFYSPPESERQYRDIETSDETNSQATSTAASVIGTNEVMSEGMGDIDTMSDAERLSTPSTWSEVGSVISDE